jgi:hypothetical protein
MRRTASRFASGVSGRWSWTAMVFASSSGLMIQIDPAVSSSAEAL